MIRAEDAMGSCSRLPTMANAPDFVDHGVANGTKDPLATNPHAIWTSTEVKSLKGKLPSIVTSPSPRTSALPLPKATRVFDPSTDTGVIRKEGLNALQRLVKQMEPNGRAS